LDREEASRALALLTRVVSQARDDTALQNWGAIWLLHGATNGAGFLATHALLGRGHATPWPYAVLWAGILGFNVATIFLLKTERSGVRSFIEGQIWSIWTTFIAALAVVAWLNWIAGLDRLFVAPVACVLAAVAFSSMGAVMGRVWYLAALAFATASVILALLPEWQFAILGGLWFAAQSGGGALMVRAKRRRQAAEAAAGAVAPPRLV